MGCESISHACLSVLLDPSTIHPLKQHPAMLIVLAGATPARIFSAWGDEDSVSYHGSNVAQATVYLFSQQGASDPDPLVHLKANDQILAFDVVPVSWSCSRRRSLKGRHATAEVDPMRHE